jgi:hypothetical protein
VKFVIRYWQYIYRFICTLMVLALDHFVAPWFASVWPQVYASSTWLGLFWLGLFVLGIGLTVNMYSLERYRGMVSTSVIWLVALIFFATMKTDAGNMTVLSLLLALYVLPMMAIAWGPWTKPLFKRCVNGLENMVRRILDPVSMEPAVVYVKFDDDTGYVPATVLPPLPTWAQ